MAVAGGLRRAADGEARVTPLELFFDLVFVFAITQVTGFLAHDPDFAHLGRGLLVLAALWWAWVAYAWLTNEVDPEAGIARLVVFAAMAAMTIAALAVPGAFGEDAVVFALAILVVRVLQLGLFAQAAAEDEDDLMVAIRHLALPSVLGPALLVVAGLVEEGTARDVLWVAALVLDYGLVFAFGIEGWRVHAAHFAERFGLIVIIALGESIVSIGVGAGEVDIDLAVVVGAILAIALAAAQWWVYFDVVASTAERRFASADGREQIAIARDSYTFLHLPMVAGIVLVALGIKKVLGDTGEPLKAMPAVALCGGTALYLLALVAFRLRNMRTLNRQRCVAAAVCLLLIPVAHEADGLVTLALVALVAMALVAYEVRRFATARARMRAAAH